MHPGWTGRLDPVDTHVAAGLFEVIAQMPTAAERRELEAATGRYVNRPFEAAPRCKACRGTGKAQTRQGMIDCQGCGGWGRKL